MDNNELIEYFQKYYDAVQNAIDPYAEEDSTVYDYSGSNVDDAFELGYNLGLKKAYENILSALTPNSE